MIMKATGLIIKRFYNIWLLIFINLYTEKKVMSHLVILLKIGIRIALRMIWAIKEKFVKLSSV